MFEQLVKDTKTDIADLSLQTCVFQERPGGMRCLMEREDDFNIRLHSNAGSFSIKDLLLPRLIGDYKFEVYVMPGQNIWITDYVSELPTLIRNNKIMDFTFPEYITRVPIQRFTQSVYKHFTNSRFGILIKDAHAGYAEQNYKELNSFSTNSFQVFNTDYNPHTNKSTLHLLTDKGEPFSVSISGKLAKSKEIIEIAYIESEQGPQHAALV